MLDTLGPWLYPLAAVGLLLLGSVVRAAAAIERIEGEPHPAGPPHHAVLVWGVLSFVVGLLGTVVGIGRVAMGARAATGAERADLAAMLAVLWDGSLVIMAPVTGGLWLLTVALCAWLGLDWWRRRRLS